MAAPKKAEKKTPEKKEKKITMLEPTRFRYRVCIETTAPLFAGIPMDPDIMRKWLEVHQVTDASGNADESVAAEIERRSITQEQMKEEIDEKLKKSTVTFLLDDDDRPCLEARTMKSCIRDTMDTAGIFGASSGVKELVRHGMQIYPRLIPIAKSVEELDIDTRVTLPKDKYGVVVAAFKRSYIMPPPVRAEFEVVCINRNGVAQRFGTAVTRKGTAAVTFEALMMIMDLAGEFQGWGSLHSQDMGRFKVMSIEDISDPSVLVK